MKLSATDIQDIQQRYADLVNYDADDPEAPIDPVLYVDSNGDHLLHIAAQRGDLRTVELLVNAGVDVNLQGDMGSTALHYARYNKNADVEKFLLSRGASPEAVNQFGDRAG